MNWTASLLRNQLKREREEYNARLNLLTSTSIDASNYQALETQKEQLEQEIKKLQSDLTDCQTDYHNLENKEQLIRYQHDNLEKDLQDLKTQHQQESWQKDKDLRDYQAYHQRELKRLNKEYSHKVKTKTAELTSQAAKLSAQITDQERELKERAKLIDKLEQKANETKQELAFSNSRIKHLQPLFTNLLQAIKNARFLTGKKELKETISQIEELMEWERSPLTETPNTPLGETE